MQQGLNTMLNLTKSQTLLSIILQHTYIQKHTINLTKI